MSKRIPDEIHPQRGQKQKGNRGALPRGQPAQQHLWHFLFLKHIISADAYLISRPLCQSVFASSGLLGTGADHCNTTKITSQNTCFS